MKVGKIYERRGRAYPNKDYEGYVYGYENRYALMPLRRLGGVYDTVGGADGRFQVTLIGMGLKVSEIRGLYENVMNELFEQLTDSELRHIVNLPELGDLRSRFDLKNRCYDALTPAEVSRLRDMVMMLPERPALHVVKEPSINPYYTMQMWYDELQARGELRSLFNGLKREAADAIASDPELADLYHYYIGGLRYYRDMDIEDVRRVLAVAERILGPRG